MQDSVPIQTGHHDVTQYQVGLIFLRKFNTCLPRIAQRDIVTAKLENGRNILTHFDIVLNDQYFMAHNFKFKCIRSVLTKSIGNKTVNVVPTSSWLSKVIVPLSKWMYF